MRLVWLNFGETWMLVDDCRILMQGRKQQVIDAANIYGIEYDQLDAATKEMQADRTNVADFGVNGTFMFATYKKLYDISDKLAS